MSEDPSDDDRAKDTSASIEKTITAKKAGLAVAGGVVSAITAILASKGYPIPVGFAAVPGVMFSLLSMLAEDHGKQRLRGLAAGYERAGRSGTPDTIAEDLYLKVAKEGGEKSLFESYRRAYEALDDAVVPYLGVLLHAHLHGELPLGLQFFRSFGRVLTELDRDELIALRTMLNGIVAKFRPQAHGFVDPSGQISDYAGSASVDNSGTSWTVQAGRGVGLVHHAHRLLLLLKNNGLAIAPDTWGDGGVWADDQSSPDQFARYFNGERNDAVIPPEFVVAMLSIIKDDIATTPEAPDGA